MALRIRFQGPTGSSLGYSIERLADGSLYDFGTSQFTSGTPGTPLQALPENTPAFPGQYKLTLTPTPSTQFTDGDYVVTVVDQTSNVVVGQLPAVMHGGDDAPVFAGGPVASVTAPVTVGTNNDKAGYALTTSEHTAIAADVQSGLTSQGLSTTRAGNLDNLDAKVSTRSTYAGGPVASVTAPVTVGTNNDKAGYSLTQTFPSNFASLGIASSGGVTVAGYVAGQDPASLVLATPANKLAVDANGRVVAGSVADKTGYALAAAGLDAIPIEAGINARQALSPILAASAGVVTGAGTGTIVIQGAETSVSRITATTDNAGNRLAVVLSLPT